MEGIQTFKGSWLWLWPWIRPYGIPSCITHRPLPIYQISFKSKKLFVDVRMYGRTDIFPPILLGRLLEVDLKTKVVVVLVAVAVVEVRGRGRGSTTRVWPHWSSPSIQASDGSTSQPDCPGTLQARLEIFGTTEQLALSTPLTSRASRSHWLGAHCDALVHTQHQQQQHQYYCCCCCYCNCSSISSSCSRSQ